MKKVYLRFYEELNDFLPLGKRKVNFEHQFKGAPSVKDLIESLGVPHTEVDLILVNGAAVDFNYNIKEDDFISVYPVFESFDISGEQRLRPKPLRDPKFILDVHLGSLAKYLRMGGLDTCYKNDLSPDEIIKISSDQKRTIITKDRNILKRKEVTHGYWLRGDEVEEQITEVIKRFHLENKLNPFSRCMECNTILLKVNKSDVEEFLPDKVKEWQNEFKRCPTCGRTYWKGSHYEKMHNFIVNLNKSL
jgi:uncharacterized protein